MGRKRVGCGQVLQRSLRYGAVSEGMNTDLSYENQGASNLALGGFKNKAEEMLLHAVCG